MRISKIIVFLLVLFLVGCSAPVEDILGNVGSPSITEQYRFGSFDSDQDTIVLIESFSEFRTFLSENHPGDEKYNSLLKLYSADFFKDNVLYAKEIMVASGSTQVSADKIQIEDSNLYLHVKLKTPEIGTSDIANWICLFGVNRQSVKDIKNVEVVIDK